MNTLGEGRKAEKLHLSLKGSLGVILAKMGESRHFLAARAELKNSWGQGAGNI